MFKFEAGNIVSLKSGGPRMTVAVSSHSPDRFSYAIDCHWFADNLLYSGRFQKRTNLNSRRHPLS